MKKWLHGSVVLAEEELFSAIRGKRIAAMINGTAIHNDGRNLIDVIQESKTAVIDFLLGMEHGVRCDKGAGEHDIGSVDKKTGIPIVDLYDYPERRPPISELRRVDAVVYCAQDAGVRHWTFTPWMFYLMDSAAEAGCEVIVVDRPNPIGGELIEGNLVKEKYLDTLLSGFGYPLRHGMTSGELALMYKNERGLDLKLTVLRMNGWERSMFYSDTGLMWVPPTINIPTPESFLDFATVGLLQSSNLSLGDRTNLPFKFIGRPEFDGERLADELNSLGLDDVYFVPRFYMASTRWEKDVLLPCQGVITVIPAKKKYRPIRAGLCLIDTISRLYPDAVDLEYKPSWARRRMGTDDIYDMINNRESVMKLIPKWEGDSLEFERRRKPYLLYG